MPSAAPLVRPCWGDRSPPGAGVREPGHFTEEVVGLCGEVFVLKAEGFLIHHRALPVLLRIAELLRVSTFDIISLPQDVYPTSTLPLDLSVLDFILIVVGAFFIVVGSSYCPAKKASEVDILTVLRNE